ncbi:putative Geranylgeranyl pyrophosphate synthase [Glarea lozoyensis 74030]|uniref:Putative Geranylgeranyl pyrophosphate synthase n=1 Tax=Glarea lozoyensis (strain ATCC 74030 / MF5533) TaxID=1104152 RepID=H0ET30_GLAL7|nr:putative Geranylgeranyl pyrophosphate synthase [Glarea lozoyensis 74030]
MEHRSPNAIPPRTSSSGHNGLQTTPSKSVLRPVPEGKLKNPLAINIYTEELLNLHRGQGMDLFWRDTLTCPSEDDYLEMVGNKTGGLFRLAIKLMQAESKNPTDCVPLEEGQLCGRSDTEAVLHSKLGWDKYSLTRGHERALAVLKFLNFLVCKLGKGNFPRDFEALVTSKMCLQQLKPCFLYSLDMSPLRLHINPARHPWPILVIGEYADRATHEILRAFQLVDKRGSVFVGTSVVVDPKIHELLHPIPPAIFR